MVRWVQIDQFHISLRAAGQVIDVPRGPAPLFQVDVEGIISAVAKHKPKVLFLTSPNNPDGSVISEEEILRLLDLPVLVVLDEAYIEFSSSRSMISEVAVRNNLIVLRTFSKRAGLAGKYSIWWWYCSRLISCHRTARRLRRFSLGAHFFHVAGETAIQCFHCCWDRSSCCIKK